MGYGEKWMERIKWCISMARFFVFHVKLSQVEVRANSKGFYFGDFGSCLKLNGRDGEGSEGSAVSFFFSKWS